MKRESPEKKILSIADIKKIVLQEKKKGKKISLANGLFDILHVGHVRYLQAAKKLADILIVGINSDASAWRIKGEGRPIMNEAERAEIIAALSCVDFVTIFQEDDAVALITALKPHYHCKGTDYTEETVPEREAVKSYGGKVQITGDPKSHSTSDLIARILKRNIMSIH